MHLTVAHCTEPGGQPVNEDYVDFCANERFGCFALADGTGGYLGGEIAAKAVVTAILKYFQESPLQRCVETRWPVEVARGALRRTRNQHPECAGMDTTMATLLIDTEAGTATWCQLGDSRIYLFRNGRARALTHDHSVVQAMIDAGFRRGAARGSKERSMLYAAVGSGEVPSTAYSDEPLSLLAGDVFLLCSDGFWDAVDEHEMEAALQETCRPEDWVGRMVDRIPDPAAPATDNFSALAVWVGERIEVTRVVAGKGRGAAS